jgi:hypothetical protein
MKQEGLDPQFEHILRGANNENINISNNNKYKNREEMANRGKVVSTKINIYQKIPFFLESQLPT